MPFLGVAGLGGLFAFLKAESKPTDVFGGVLSEDSTYFYRTFRGSGSFTVTGGTLAADVLVIAGGGGGQGGGGGAGGLQGFLSQKLTPTSYTVTVGSGGANNASGTNSQFGSLTASVGGGYGGSWQQASGGSGGSGGGGAGTQNSSNATGGAGTAGQGNVGGGGWTGGASPLGGGGGGGAGSAGTTATSTTGQPGGNGVATYSSWHTATGTGVSGYIAGGGGGGGSAAGSAGGSGGGGTGNYGSPTAGASNTGSGGGGSYTVSGGAGGSGIVIVRYEKTAVQASTSAYELIGTISLTSAQTSVTFSGIPGSYKHLQVRMLTRSDFGSTSDALNIQVNGDTTASYSRHWLEGNGSSVGGFVDTSATKAWLGRTVADGNTANVYTPWIVDILDYAQTNKNTTIRSFSGNVVGTINYVTFASGLWYKTPAVTSLTFLNNTGGYKSGSRFSLYGIRG
jgi:hypothetical protein